jgi:hypothetical protein
MHVEEKYTPEEAKHIWNATRCPKATRAFCHSIAFGTAPVPLRPPAGREDQHGSLLRIGGLWPNSRAGKHIRLTHGAVCHF